MGVSQLKVGIVGNLDHLEFTNAHRSYIVGKGILRSDHRRNRLQTLCRLLGLGNHLSRGQGDSLSHSIHQIYFNLRSLSTHHITACLPANLLRFGVHQLNI